MLAGAACSTRSQVYSTLSDMGVGCFLFTIDSDGPTTPEPLPLLLLHALRSKKSIL